MSSATAEPKLFSAWELADLIGVETIIKLQLAGFGMNDSTVFEGKRHGQGLRFAAFYELVFYVWEEENTGIAVVVTSMEDEDEPLRIVGGVNPDELSETIYDLALELGGNS